MLVQIVRYRSGLDDDEVRATVESRAPAYMAVAGLVQKYYLRFPESGEHGGVYLWASRESLPGRSASPSSRAPSRTRIGSTGTPHVEIADVSKVLHPRCATHA